MVKTVIGLFATPSSAQSVVDSLVDNGIRRIDIRLIPEIVTETDESEEIIETSSEKASSGVQSAEVDFEKTAPPSSAAVELIELGMPEKKAVYYSEAVRRGGTLVCVTVDEGQISTAQRIIDSHGSLEINNQAAQWRQGGWELPGESDDNDVLVVQTTYVLGK